ncbi:hypothetical protein MPTK1_5g23990 [Marchantia polymorpha subsp. ruderalis]|uniref:Uncharacterized protein n=1 Tax=Marchantia polymorpha subsp. ruderalis TaxID=1480154 RepID=A0AAF6BLN6_MARPO|nr:hypothetical protein Mp_5g23990 [Marchantia polymorpha subsp. ruderalis]
MEISEMYGVMLYITRDISFCYRYFNQNASYNMYMSVGRSPLPRLLIRVSTVDNVSLTFANQILSFQPTHPQSYPPAYRETLSG